jgi:hypothetical protein
MGQFVRPSSHSLAFFGQASKKLAVSKNQPAVFVGRPQFGQAGACTETFQLQSGHLVKLAVPEEFFCDRNTKKITANTTPTGTIIIPRTTISTSISCMPIPNIWLPRGVLKLKNESESHVNPLSYRVANAIDGALGCESGEPLLQRYRSAVDRRLARCLQMEVC